jgi:hypothetical protein
MKFINMKQTGKVFLLLIVSLYCLLNSAESSKINARVSAKENGEEDVIDSCFICRGPSTLYKNKSDANKYISVCKFEGKIAYNVERADGEGNSSNSDKNTRKVTVKPDATLEKDLKENYTKVDIYKKMDSKCNTICGLKGHSLFKFVGHKRAHVCTCTILGFGKTYYILTHKEARSATEEKSKITEGELKLVKEAETSGNLVTVPPKEKKLKK